MKRTPADIAMMSPQEAYAAGDADGREALTASLHRDEAAAKASETIEAKRTVDERLRMLERSVGTLLCEAADHAGMMAHQAKRLAAFEIELRCLREEDR